MPVTLPSSVAHARGHDFVVLDKKTQQLKSLSSLKDRMSFWVKTKFSSKSQVATQNHKVQDAIRKHFQEVSLHKWSKGDVNAVLGDFIALDKPLHARDLKVAAFAFHQYDSGLSGKRELKDRYNLEVRFGQDQEASKAIDCLREEGVPMKNTEDLAKGFRNMDALEQSLSEDMGKIFSDMKGLNRHSPEASQRAARHFGSFCSKLRQHQNLKLLGQCSGISLDSGVRAKTKQGKANIRALDKEIQRLQQNMKLGSNPATMADLQVLSKFRKLNSAVQKEKSPQAYAELKFQRGEAMGEVLARTKSYTNEELQQKCDELVVQKEIESANLKALESAQVFEDMDSIDLQAEQLRKIFDIANKQLETLPSTTDQQEVKTWQYIAQKTEEALSASDSVIQSMDNLLERDSKP